jgi:two-component sensor histidine kinase
MHTSDISELPSVIDWPAVIVYDGDDELVYVESEKAWLSEAESLLYNIKANDCLIDSRGNIFKLARVHDAIETERTGEQITLDAFIRLVRIHASNSHRCCIEKISFRTIAEGIKLIDSMDET